MSGRFLLVLMSSILLAGLAPADKPKPRDDDKETLRQYADKLGFRIGAGIRPRSWDQDAEGRRLLGTEFNSTIEMAMMRVMQPDKGRFDFTQMDRTMGFAKEHNLKIWGAALIYRAGDLAEWMKQRGAGHWDKAELDGIMKNEIQTVVRHGGDAFYAWGVVNEPLSNRNQPWKNVMGEVEYITKAFQYAREATQSDLVLNETFGFQGVDRDRTDQFFSLLKRAQAQGAPIDGAGIEMHLEAQQLRPNYLDEFRYFLQRAHEAKVKVYITEMDVYQGPAGAFPDAMENQKKIYHDIAATCLADTACRGLTVWDLSDRDTWLATKQMNPHPDAKPDLFDANDKKKPAYYGVLEALKERAARN
jgi:endo-1,4-beta-xylanase